LIESIENIKKFFLGALFAGKKMNIIDKKQMGGLESI
jgi:hypothetical protein